MNREESIALWRRGEDAWNDWAKNMQRQKAHLETTGAWNGDGVSAQRTSEALKWIEAASVDLSGLRFSTRAQSGKNEENSQLKPDVDVKIVVVEGDQIDFAGLMFPWEVRFDDAQFHGHADFHLAEFYGEASFWRAQFHRNADFDYTQFSSASFSDAHFHGGAFFNDAHFKNANFGAVQFHGDAVFSHAEFHGDAFFDSSSFESAAWFDNALFYSRAVFTAIKSGGAFDLGDAQFSKVPAFNQADFKQAPDLDKIRIPPRPFWRGSDEKLIPQYRALKRLAVQGYDYEREHMAFKGELRSRRWTTDKWWHPSLLLGILYDGVADCGRSIIRPLVAWAIVVALFSALYLAYAGVPVSSWQNTCASSPMQKWERAVSLSMSVGVPLIGNSRTEEVRLFYDCISQQLATPVTSMVPLSANVLQVIELVLSATLIFLFLLALKNQFKIK